MSFYLERSDFFPTFAAEKESYNINNPTNNISKNKKVPNNVELYAIFRIFATERFKV